MFFVDSASVWVEQKFERLGGFFEEFILDRRLSSDLSKAKNF